MNRRPKQLIYGLFYLLILAFIFVGLYLLFLKPGPSCSDGIKNQGEAGVDCGGPCAKICFPADFEELQVVQEKFFRLPAGRVSFFAEIKNSNPDLAAKNFKYAFELSNDQGQLLDSESGDAFVYANDTSYLLIPNLAVAQASAYKLKVEVSGVEWTPKESLPKPLLTFKDTEISLVGNEIIARGLLVNQSFKPLIEVRILAIFYGRFGKPIGASETILNNLLPDQSQTFVVNHPPLSEVDSAATRLIAIPPPL